MSSVVTDGNASASQPSDPLNIWNTKINDGGKSSSKNPFKRFRRVLSVKVPPSRRRELAGVNIAISAVVWILGVSTLLLLAYAVSQFLLPAVASGVVAVVLAVLSIYLCVTTYELQAKHEAQLLLLSMGFLIVASVVILGFDSALYIRTVNEEFPTGCRNARPTDTPLHLPTTCSRYQRVAIAGLVLMSVICASYIGSFIFSLILVERVTEWTKARHAPAAEALSVPTPNTTVSGDMHSLTLHDSDALSFDGIHPALDLTAVTEPVVPQPNDGDASPRSDASSSHPPTPIERYHLTEYQLEPSH